jgi:N-acetyl-gamma-glutamyl-phosphate reductase
MVHNYESPNLSDRQALGEGGSGGHRLESATDSGFAGARLSRTGARRVAVVGARGYSGLELCRILLRHPEVELAACFANEKPFSLAEYLPEAGAAEVPVLPLADFATSLSGIDTVFLATPAEASLELVPQALAHCSVVDLSGAFRLQSGNGPARFAEWYKAKHSAPELLFEATYGLSPFAAPGEGDRQLVANPGCYATAVLMALVPLLKAGVIDAGKIAVDAKSGTSGAGRKGAENLLFTEVEGECLPYRVGRHQHLPEIQEWAEFFSGQAIDPFFCTHLLPVRRGILASVYAELAPGKGQVEVAQAFSAAYAGYPLARVTAIEGGQGNIHPALALSMKRVVGSARVHLAHQVNGNKLYLFSLIDNLLKGAASQAVENFNRKNDWPVALGLAELEGTL